MRSSHILYVVFIAFTSIVYCQLPTGDHRWESQNGEVVAIWNFFTDAQGDSTSRFWIDFV
jgi:hypothetical protein